MKVRCTFQDRQWTVECGGDEVIIGRARGEQTVHLDLSPDQTVSRPHARLFAEKGDWWLEDLGSRNGTHVNGELVSGKRRLGSGDVVGVGETTLTLEGLESDRTESIPVPAATPPPRDVAITVARAAHEPAFTHDVASEESARRLSILYSLPLELGAETQLEALLQSVVERAVGAIPGAGHGALLVREPDGKLLLKAHVPSGNPAASITLARRAMEKQQAFIWRMETDPTVSQTEFPVQSGLYAPLTWGGETVGVLCVGSSEPAPRFDDNALQFLVAVAHHAAMAVIHRRTHDKLEHSSAILGRLLTNFSPKVRTRLLERANRQRLRLGGENSEVTILVSDIRGFTRLTAAMDVADVVDMLNEYFSSLVSVIFKFDGTVDKFVGDAILAVFGSPEPDADQCEKAVRAAVEMQTTMREINERRKATGQTVCDMGIGVHCGEVLHGFIGSHERMEFTVIGDAVNRTGRYCDGAEAGAVVVSPAVHERVWKLVHASPVTVQTKHEGPLPGFQIQGWRGIAEGERPR